MGTNPGKQKLKRHHHTVPRLLLRRFADGKRIMRVPLDGSEPKPIGIGDATVRSHFYSMQDETGQRDDSIENLLADLEDQAARVIAKVIDEHVWPLPIDDRAVLGEWVAAQSARIPAARKANNEIADQLLKMEIAAGGKPEVRRRMEAQGKGPVSDEDVEATWAELTDFSGYFVELPVNDHLLTMADAMVVAYEWMMARSWQLCRFGRRTLLLSDHPVALLRDETAPAWSGVGLANAAAIMVPIDRQAAIIMTAPGGQDGIFPASAKLAKELNHRFAWNSRIELFHHPDDNPLAGINLPPVRDREAEFSQTAERFLMPEGPSEAFKSISFEGPPPNAKAPRRARGSRR
ncbi:DUF4238 domain-containing protein [Streptomyces sp. MA5143a]|uniref:DUF4238 domain-containing protein n=1 Tax=Streptomyces sp. MA5143a TaxID=2083010 RepID=UPI000D1A724E|nr:DUF4238 domain-containing protein [Streptomyces sp. MA5143a]SPE99989.1 hypothetical protein SMA5143A_0698 [Streptomyces sp. MA5143a]